MKRDHISQREMMRRLVAELGHKRDAVCAAYVQAERDGKVVRKRNGSAHTPETYALALWNDGINKGWLSADLPTAGELRSIARRIDRLADSIDR